MLQLLSLIIVLQIFIKTMSFLRGFESFGLLVSLIRQCLQDIMQYLLFMLFWIIFFWIEYLILGLEVDQEEYPLVNFYLQILVQAWRNAIGDTSVPKYTYIEENKKGIVIISSLWTIWLLNQFFVLIILLNFLIAFIS